MIRAKTWLGGLVLIAAIGACGTEEEAPEQPAGGDEAPELPQGAEVDPLPEVGLPELPAPAFEPPGYEARGLFELRTIIHLHSAFSHDGCDDEGIDEEGNPNWDCINRMKAALCKEEIAVAFMTDHPSHVADQPFDTVHYTDLAAGDVSLTDGEGHEWGARYACPQGQGGPDGTVIQVAGFENLHNMPIGLRHHVDQALYDTRITSDLPDEQIAALTAGVEAAGGMVTIPHSEEKDIDWQTIAAHDIAAMEIYNFHANFTTILDGDLLTALSSMDPFLSHAPDAPASDLVGLAMLHAYPEPALEKWRRVTTQRHITAIGGSDVHENVILPPICAAEGLCDDLVEDYPNMVEALKTEGPVMMPDGERIDGYGRVFRWVQNRVRVDPDADVLTATEAALRAGQNIVVFEILGDAPGVDLIVNTGNEDAPEWREMGSSVPQGATLWARTPDSPGDGAEMSATLWRSHGDTSEPVHEWTEAGAWTSLPLDAPGAYYMEVWLKPGHLLPSLKGVEHLAEPSYRWVVTNAIYVAESE